MINELAFAFSITGPVLILMMLGYSVRRMGLIDRQFISQANSLIYNIALPVMLFFSISSQPLHDAIDVTLTLVGLIGTFLLVGVLLLISRLVPVDQRGVFVQGSYRGNLAILGVALAVATYGSQVLPLVAVYIAVITTAYNVLAVWVLNSSGALRQIARNPLIIGILCGIVVSLIKLPIPQVLQTSGVYISGMTLPVALICIGASIDLNSLGRNSRLITLAVLFKLIVSPILLVLAGLYFGLRGTSLGVLFFLAGAPTASASYIMARQLTSHGKLAAEIVAVTTALGVISYTAGLALLRSQGLI
ncbi:MAG: AEC family transporter [Granulosicoccus sp.]